MVEITSKSVASYLLELVAGLAIILGLLMAFAGLAGSNLITAILGSVLIIGGVFVFKRPGRSRRTN